MVIAAPRLCPVKSRRGRGSVDLRGGKLVIQFRVRQSALRNPVCTLPLPAHVFWEAITSVSKFLIVRLAASIGGHHDWPTGVARLLGDEVLRCGELLVVADRV